MVPVSTYGHTLATIEMFISLLFTATTTGLIFVRFSKPKAKLLFAEKATVTRYADGRAFLVIRVGNGRSSPLLEASARLTAIFLTSSSEDERFNNLIDLNLVRDKLSYFSMTWTFAHEITEDSPLAALRTLEQEQVETMPLWILLHVSAYDKVIGATIHDTRIYTPKELVLNARYANIVTLDEAHHATVDMRRLSEVETA